MMNRQQCTVIIVVLLMATFMMWGCSTFKTIRPHLSPAQNQLAKVLSGEALLGDGASQLPLPEEDIFEITPEMRDFLNMHVPSRLNNYYKLKALSKAVRDKSLLGWKPNAYKTYSASKSFHHKQGSCLSYAIMMMVLGRELGLDLYFNEVEMPFSYDMKTAQYVRFRHVNVFAKACGKHKILDLDLEEYDSSYRQHRITDSAVEAHYYNNRGVYYLNVGNMEQAFLHFRKALALQPELDFLWANIGVLYLRNGHYKEAEAALLNTLVLAPSNTTAIYNLQRLYVKQGNTELANYYGQEAERHRMKNPYYRYSLAKHLLKNKQPDLALRHIKSSIRMCRKEHLFHFLAARIYARLGKYDDMEESLERAARLTENEKTRLQYQSKLARLKNIPKQDSTHLETVFAKTDYRQAEDVYIQQD
jgi:Flp pilus assembly protein TadD